MKASTMNEQDQRLAMLNGLLTTPHRELGLLWPVHRDLVDRDPRFYVRLAAWYADHGDVRDHKELFVVGLALSDFPGHRDVGLALLRELPPYEVARVVDFIHGRKARPARDPAAPAVAPAPAAKRGRKAARKAAVAAKAPAAKGAEPKHFGLFRNLPRSLRTEVTRYLREREADPDRFDGAVLSSRKSLKRLYALLHVKPSERAQRALFDDAPPEGSRLDALKRLAKAGTPADQARLILEHRIPYRVASSVVAQMTPTVLLALIESMSPQELINALASLKKRGALDHPDLKARIERKLEQAKSARRVSAFKAEKALEVAEFSEEVAAKLHEVADAQVKAKGRIVRPTALLIDKSSSMESAIELGKRIGAMISAVCDAPLYVYAFDDLSHRIDPGKDDLASWEKALLGIKAGNSTSCGAPLAAMTRAKLSVDQIVMITDEEENTAPMFVDALKAYRSALGADPNVCIVKTPRASDLLEVRCRQAGIPVDAYQFHGDYYSLTNLIPLLCRPSKRELLEEILAYPLPTRGPAGKAG